MWPRFAFYSRVTESVSWVVGKTMPRIKIAAKTVCSVKCLLFPSMFAYSHPLELSQLYAYTICRTPYPIVVSNENYKIVLPVVCSSTYVYFIRSEATPRFGFTLIFPFHFHKPPQHRNMLRSPYYNNSLVDYIFCAAYVYEKDEFAYTYAISAFTIPTIQLLSTIN